MLLPASGLLRPSQADPGSQALTNININITLITTIIINIVIYIVIVIVIAVVTVIVIIIIKGDLTNKTSYARRHQREPAPTCSDHQLPKAPHTEQAPMHQRAPSFKQSGLADNGAR